MVFKYQDYNVRQFICIYNTSPVLSVTTTASAVSAGAVSVATAPTSTTASAATTPATAAGPTLRYVNLNICIWSNYPVTEYSTYHHLIDLLVHILFTSLTMLGILSRHE